ncbi:MAG: hypothetical protein A2169_04245 [Deltaproteobacteria bacterium RBG_13_47_9]|nr:MAG: hypothetical protein A2169_04245 [Deltaproteobacteria bacterium RBG_13_47_9]
MIIYKNPKGFTLIEAIAVLIIVGILSAVIISRITSTSDVSIKAQAEAMKSHIRYVQMRAMNMTSFDPTNCAASFGMVISGNSYSMFRDCNTSSKVVLPGANSSSGVTLLDGMTVNTATPAFSFDNWGRPYPNANGTGTSLNISLSLSGEPITVIKNTGYVP